MSIKTVTKTDLSLKVIIIISDLNYITFYEGRPESNATHFLGPILLDKNILPAAAFKCPVFMHVVSTFPAR
jgi:hypothetical protein